MFNNRLKKDLEAKDAELAILRQLMGKMNSDMLSLTLDTDFKICAFNDRFASTLGYSHGHLQGRPLAEIVPPYVKNLPCFHNFRAAVAKLEPVSDDYRYLRADGSLAWLKIHWYPIATADGKLSHIQGFGSDISEAVYRAKENEAFITALLRSTAVIQFNLDGTVVTANEQFLQTMGYSLAELKGKHHSLFCAPEDAASADYKAFWQKLNRGEYVADRFKRVDRHGHEVWLEATYNPVHDTEGNLYKVVKFANVVTDQVMREAEVRQAAGVAYDISLQTDVSAERGASVVKDTLVTMQKITDQVQSATDGIEALGKQSLLISSIVQTIGGIAAQTNLLALNAAIDSLMATAWAARSRATLSRSLSCSRTWCSGTRWPAAFLTKPSGICCIGAFINALLGSLWPALRCGGSWPPAHRVRLSLARAGSLCGPELPCAASG